MRVAIVRTMAEFSMDIYANGIISGLHTVRPGWEILDLKPRSVDRESKSHILRAEKAYERFWRFPQWVKQQTSDIFHIIDPAEAHIIYGLRRLGKPTVVTCHDLVNFYQPDNLEGSVQLPLISRRLWLHAIRGMQYADHIFAVSSATAKDTTQILNINPSLITVTPNGVDPIFRPISQEHIHSLRKQLGVSPETMCLLNVGSNDPRKNILSILRTLNILKQQGCPVCFWKVGTNFTPEQNKFIEGQELQEYIRYLGKPGREELVQIYNAADVLIAPSLHEGFGLTLLEAMSCGTPVITSRVSAMPEVVGDAGLLVDPTDPSAIANAVCHLLKDISCRQSLIDKGLARAKQFTWEAVSEKIAQVYERVALQKH
jgi:glycosyltransferase involved in cell wall biosynthesis